MENNTKTWVIEELENLLNNEKLEDSLLVKTLYKNTNGELYSNYWTLNVKGKGLIDLNYLDDLFAINGKEIKTYEKEINEYVEFHVYDILLNSYQTDIMGAYNLEVLGRCGGHWGVDLNSIRYYVDVDDSIVEDALKNVDVDSDDYDYYERIAEWIYNNNYSSIKIDIDDFIDKFNSFENELNKDDEFMGSECFAEDIYNDIMDN